MIKVMNLIDIPNFYESCENCAHVGQRSTFDTLGGFYEN
tara:strand:+ start:387 stop:503 length:117 start_codon:yes stop_codon:yes gene_type:complete